MSYECPKSAITAASVAWLEMFGGYRMLGGQAMGQWTAKDAEAMALLQEEWEKVRNEQEDSSVLDLLRQVVEAAARGREMPAAHRAVSFRMLSAGWRTIPLAQALPQASSPVLAGVVEWTDWIVRRADGETDLDGLGFAREPDRRIDCRVIRWKERRK